MAKDQQGGGGASSMLQGLQGILGMLGSLMAAPDADPQFLSQLQMAIVGKIRQSTQHAIGMQQQGTANAIQPGGGGGMSGLGGAPQQGAAAALGGGPGGPPGGPGGGGPGPGASGAPNPDELRRVLGANAQTG